MIISWWKWREMLNITITFELIIKRYIGYENNAYSNAIVSKLWIAFLGIYMICTCMTHTIPINKIIFLPIIKHHFNCKCVHLLQLKYQLIYSWHFKWGKLKCGCNAYDDLSSIFRTPAQSSEIVTGIPSALLDMTFD